MILWVEQGQIWRIRSVSFFLTRPRFLRWSAIIPVGDTGVCLQWISLITYSLNCWAPVSLSQINRVRHLFSREVLNTILNSLVFSKLFYCSTVWSGTSKDNVHKPQLLQNFAARILTNTKKYDHISPILNELGWLTIEELLNLCDLIMICKCINGLAPNYLSSKLYKRSDTHAYNTRLKEHLSLPLCTTSIAQRNFYFRALESWNKLSVATRNSSSLAQFKRRARGEMRSVGKWFLILYI